jgi:hypothetical protein
MAVAWFFFEQESTAWNPVFQWYGKYLNGPVFIDQFVLPGVNGMEYDIE